MVSLIMLQLLNKVYEVWFKQQAINNKDKVLWHLVCADLFPDAPSPAAPFPRVFGSGFLQVIRANS